MVDRVLLASPRGFCAGVDMAIKALAWMVRAFPPPVYCYHEIVHNRLVVDRFRDLGVIFVDDVSEVPEGAPLMLSAHGSAPEVVQAARARGGMVVDAVCPLVTKVHHEVKTRADRGYTVVYVGHEGHDEAIGTMAVAPDAVRLVENVADIEALEDPGTDIALLAQTTLSHDEWSGVRDKLLEKFPDTWMPGRSDLCFATTNRQAALKEIAQRADTILVIGSENSSNTMALVRVVSSDGRRVIRVNGAEEVPDGLEGTVAVTAGASAPEEVVRAVIERLAPRHGVEEVSVTEEDEYFPLPPELRELVRGMSSAFSVASFALPDPKAALAQDRKVTAGDVLVNLTAPEPRRTDPAAGSSARR
ncbi:MAG TPA: 4-hydroxy-3-methylbut-2-enyl diphosphate reductase [Acidimicrobiales bacterium]|nr:4-hydroxy-3-methylbut-2-enyl diphosphate reductase [Acidimicrobiales bacterium]